MKQGAGVDRGAKQDNVKLRTEEKRLIKMGTPEKIKIKNLTPQKKNKSPEKHTAHDKRHKTLTN